MGASNLLLTVPRIQGQNCDRHLLNEMAGFSSPTLEAHKSRATPAAFLCPKYGSPYNGRAVWEGAIPAGPLAGLLTRTVPPTRLAAGKRSSSTALEDSIMANTATSTGKIRPNSTVTEIRWIKEPTAIKRLRRHLATIGQQLVITKEGTWQRQHWGRMAIVENTGEVHQKSVDLESRLRAFGMMADDERIEYRHDKFWLHHVARRVTVEVNGQRATYHEQLTRDFTTAKAATKAAESIKDQRE